MSINMYKNGLLVAAGLLLASVSPAMSRAAIQAQDSGQAQTEPEPGSARGPNLSLSDDQKAQMKKIHEDAKSQVTAVNNDSSLSVDQKQAKIQQIHRDTHKQIEAMLTPEQRKTMREWRREHRSERRQQKSEQPPAQN